MCRPITVFYFENYYASNTPPNIFRYFIIDDILSKVIYIFYNTLMELINYPYFLFVRFSMYFWTLTLWYLKENEEKWGKVRT